MTSQIIGALRIDLGLDSAAFTTGLKTAQTEIGGFTKKAQIGFAALSVAAATVTTALSVATKRAIDHADALSKLAQRSGLTTEAFSRLSYAASFSDVSSENLAESLGRLSQAMSDAAKNSTGTAATAFAALGISVTDASGHLRNAGDVFTEIASKFSQLEDGSTKTSLALQIFGKSGAALIPLLNGGASEMKRLGDESDRTGNTLSTKTGQAAEHFNDTMTAFGKRLDGLTLKLAEGLLPILNSLADGLTKIDPTALTVGSGIAGIGTAAAIAAPAVGGLTKAMSLLYSQLALIAALPGGVLALAGGLYLGSTSPAGAGEDALVHQLGLTRLPQGGAFTGGWGSTGLTSVPGTTTLGVAPSTFDFGSFFKDLDDAATGKALDAVADKLSNVKLGLEAIGPAAGLAQQAMADGFNTSVGALGNLSGALSAAFKDSKAFAVSTAILQGLQGVAYALGSSPPPWNFINAGAVGIEAAANVASILATNENSTSMPSGTGASAAAAAAPAAQSAINFTFRGQGTLSVDDFVDQLTQHIADGGYQSLIKVIRSA